MKLLTKSLLARLIKNGQKSAAGLADDHVPVVKLFTPDAQATWLLTEVRPDDPDQAFGLCDLGMGYPELGYVSLAELGRLRGLMGLPVERDMYTRLDKPLSHYASVAAENGRITA